MRRDQRLVFAATQVEAPGSVHGVLPRRCARFLRKRGAIARDSSRRSRDQPGASAAGGAGRCRGGVAAYRTRRTRERHLPRQRRADLPAFRSAAGLPPRPWHHRTPAPARQNAQRVVQRQRSAPAELARKPPTSTTSSATPAPRLRPKSTSPSRLQPRRAISSMAARPSR